MVSSSVISAGKAGIPDGEPPPVPTLVKR